MNAKLGSIEALKTGVDADRSLNDVFMAEYIASMIQLTDSVSIAECRRQIQHDQCLQTDQGFGKIKHTPIWIKDMTAILLSSPNGGK